MVNTYDMSIPLFTRALENQLKILKQGEEWCTKNGKDASALLDAKLCGDMKTLPSQIRYATDTAKFVAVRLGGIENQVWEDNEKTFPELFERVQKAIDFLKQAKPEQFEGAETKDVTLTPGGKEIKFTGMSYLQGFAIPNFFFHHVTAYAILRNAGVPVGKWDYLGNKP